MSTLYTSDENGKKCQQYTHVVKRFKMSTVYTSDENVKHVIIMHEWKWLTSWVFNNFKPKITHESHLASKQGGSFTCRNQCN